MPQLEQYLRRATRFVWGRRRAEVREELEAHILERAARLQALGLTPQDALDRTLREFGQPGTVALAFGKVHTMNTLLLVLVATSATVFTRFNSHTHQIQGLGGSSLVLEGHCENGNYFERPRDGYFGVTVRDGTPNGAHIVLSNNGRYLLQTLTPEYRAWIRTHVKGCENLS